MRYYTELTDLVNEHLCELLSESWNLFAVDLLYFFACEYETGWIPYRVGGECGGIMLAAPRNYTPHPLSPFTDNMRRSIRYGILPADEAFEETCNQIAPPGVEDKLARFLAHVVRAFDDFFAEDRTMKDMYFILLYVGKLATIFHLHGTPDAPQCALTLIANAVMMLLTKFPIAQAFKAMDNCAEVICAVYEQNTTTA